MSSFHLKPRKKVRSTMLTINTQSIIQKWLKRTREEIPFAAAEDENILIDHFPIFVDIISKLILRPTDKNLLLQCMENAKLHGHQRATRTSYTVEQLPIEYTLLRECLIADLDTHRTGLTLAKINILLSAFDASIGSSVAE